MPGHWELIIVAAVVLLLFGPRFGRLCRSAGECIGIIRRIGDGGSE